MRRWTMQPRCWRQCWWRGRWRKRAASRARGNKGNRSCWWQFRRAGRRSRRREFRDSFIEHFFFFEEDQAGASNRRIFSRRINLIFIGEQDRVVRCHPWISQLVGGQFFQNLNSLGCSTRDVERKCISDHASGMVRRVVVGFLRQALPFGGV